MAALLAAIFFIPVFSEESSLDALENELDSESSGVSSVSDENSDSESDSSFDFSDDFGDLFSGAEDTDEAVVTETESSGTDTTFNIASLSIPLKMSGDLDAELGAALINEDGETSGTGYFDLLNYLFFTARPDKYMAVKGSLKTSLIDSEEAEEENQNKYFYLYELYFDYIMMDKVYITAGKKKTVWGNIRLFSNDDDFENDDDALYTNALYDSRYNISGILRVPFGFSTLTLLTMYRGGDDEPTHRDLSYAGSIEAVLFGTSINLFGRTFPSRYGSQKKYYSNPIIGAEVKRTIFGIDIYAQAIGRVDSNKTLREFWKPELYWRSSYEKAVFTAGFYKLFTEHFPYFGINAEFQSIYYPNDVVHYVSGSSGNSFKYLDDLENEAGYSAYEATLKEGESGYTTVVDYDKGTLQNRLIVDVGLTKLGPSRNMKVGVQWFHDFDAEKGYVKPAFVASRIFPHCDWQTGFKWEYSKDQKYFGKITIGTYFKFSLDY